MGKTLSAFAASMRQRAKDLPGQISYVAREGAEAVIRDWLEVMPVDTSLAISNTRIGIGTAPIGELEPYAAGHKGSTRGESAGAALTHALEELDRKKPGQPIYMSNTARHIGDLDRGSSIQFSGGFIPRGLIVFHEAADACARKLSNG